MDFKDHRKGGWCRIHYGKLSLVLDETTTSYRFDCQAYIGDQGIEIQNKFMNILDCISYIGYLLRPLWFGTPLKYLELYDHSDLNKPKSSQAEQLRQAANS